MTGTPNGEGGYPHQEELSRQVWDTPMSHLATRYGISGNGLTKVCDRLKVPYLPRDYWAKKAPGMKETRYRLLDREEGTSPDATISPTPPPVSLPELPPKIPAQQHVRILMRDASLYLLHARSGCSIVPEPKAGRPEAPTSKPSLTTTKDELVMAETMLSTPAGRVRASVRLIPLPTLATSSPPVLDRAEQDTRAEQAVPGVLVVASLVEAMLQSGRMPSARFWRGSLTRHAAVLVAARRHPGRVPTALDLTRVGWADARYAICDAAVAHTARVLGLAA